MFGDFEKAIEILERVKDLAPEEEKLGVQQAIIELQNALLQEIQTYEEAESEKWAGYQFERERYESH